ncbi:hypothetical protein JNM87_04180 [Candidatus Saccharibacteria bacterium]|nr:hypothetical protein [Candidatus Saccharibacteria bacterium]
MPSYIASLFSFYWVPSISTTLVYMLQATEYQPGPFIRWFWRTNDFSAVMQRRQLDPTKAARFIRLFTLLGMLAQLAIGGLLMYAGLVEYMTSGIFFGLAVLLLYPILWAHLLALLIWGGHLTVLRSRERNQAAEATALFAAHAGLKVAIVGSYGKTSMKELLLTVLDEAKTVAATPANMNVLSSHVAFARKLTGAEDIVLVEFGEGKPGDVARFSSVVQPTYAVITGLAPAHLDQYRTLKAAGRDIFSVADTVEADRVYVNADSAAVRDFLRPDFRIYSRSTVLGWRIVDAATSLSGTTFVLVKGKKRLSLRSHLIGLHQVGPLAFAAAFALFLGVPEKKVQAGVAKTKPYEHRMQPYQLGGAWVIDDTYNGNLEGIKAGTELLGSLKAKRKIYVTPGLVDQGKETAAIHKQVGHYIAAAEPNMVVLMQNSACQHIQDGLREARYKGTVRIEKNPILFYQNLQSFVAKGDVVLMQNDWTDNYS